ncbi:MAG TPA: hypothetical protein PLX97_09195, partial [Gemmatales bacterium]|nr:hypothetical protein [Gemmatales bacterium]
EVVRFITMAQPCHESGKDEIYRHHRQAGLYRLNRSCDCYNSHELPSFANLLRGWQARPEVTEREA